MGISPGKHEAFSKGFFFVKKKQKIFDNLFEVPRMIVKIIGGYYQALHYDVILA
jgi:hypothetical protein